MKSRWEVCGECDSRNEDVFFVVDLATSNSLKQADGISQEPTCVTTTRTFFTRPRSTERFRISRKMALVLICRQ